MKTSLPDVGDLPARWGLSRVVACLLLPYCSASWPVAAMQLRVERKPPVFRAKQQLVAMPVFVRDREGNPVAGLTAGDFQVLDDGLPVKVTVDEEQPRLRLILLVQNNRRAARALTLVRKTGSLLTSLVAGASSEVAVISFSDGARQVLGFTSDEDRIVQAIQRLRPVSGENTLLDALEFCAGLLRDRGAETGARYVLLVIGETRDRGSTTRFSQARDKLLRESCSVYFATYSAYRMPFAGRPVYECKTPGCEERDKELVQAESGRGVLGELKRWASVDAGRQLARETGGAVFSFYTKGAIEESLQRIGRSVHQGYALTFPPAALPGDAAGFREIRVRVRTCPECAVQFRSTYYYTP